MVRIIDDATLARQTVLRREPFEMVTDSPAMRERTIRTFGEYLTPDQVVARILHDVRTKGDAALCDYSARLDGAHLTPEQLTVSRAEIEEAYTLVPQDVVDAMRLAAERIHFFHSRFRRQSWLDWQGDSALGQVIRPLQRAGLYVPGGTAAYPSSLLMSAIPAKVAGVEEIIVTTPAGRDGKIWAPILVAADIAGVNRVVKLGGAQGIGALAYGTESVPKVDKILGPGNLIVVLAKKHVFGDVDIDQLPGPTEVLIIADDTPDPEMVAADLLSQAEHDVLASAILLTTSRQMAEAVAAELDKQLPLLPRAPIAGGSLERNGGIVLVRDIAEAIELANEYAPEHLCLLIRDAWQWVGQVRNAGAVFVGESAPEVIGDYVAGPSHILPTGGTARFFSPVHVEDFVKVISVIGIGPRDFERIGPAAMTFAEAEGLQAHASAVRRRLAKRGIMQGYQQAGATEPAGGTS